MEGSKSKAYTHISCTDLDIVIGFIWFGDHSTSKTPGPIPNPAVKCRRANGTAS